MAISVSCDRDVGFRSKQRRENKPKIFFKKRIFLFFVAFSEIRQRVTMGQTQSTPTKLPLKLHLDNDQEIIDSVRSDIDQLNLSDRGLCGVDESDLRRFLSINVINLSGNRFAELPSVLFDMLLCRSLNASSNQLTSVSSDIGKLTAIKNLHLARNHLRVLPDEIGLLSQLQWLNVSNNELVTLPGSVGRLAALELLSAEQNEIKWLPLELNELPAHTELFLFGNDTFASIPRMGFRCRKMLPDLLAATTHIGTIRERATTACVGLQDLELPALVTLEIVDALLENDVRMFAKWELITAVKHFHQRRQEV
jgi:Leucine-rich repeat (LRR) protein